MAEGIFSMLMSQMGLSWILFFLTLWLPVDLGDETSGQYKRYR